MATTKESGEKASTDYCLAGLGSPAGLLRTAEGVLAVGGIVSYFEGIVCYPGGNTYTSYLTVSFISLLHCFLVLPVICFRLEKKITIINVPLTLLLNDFIRVISYSLVTILMITAIEDCQYMMGARIAAAVIGIANTFTVAGLCYTDYRWWKGIATPYHKFVNEPAAPPIKA